MKSGGQVRARPSQEMEPLENLTRLMHIDKLSTMRQLSDAAVLVVRLAHSNPQTKDKSGHSTIND
jgi:hypothetical protein